MATPSVFDADLSSFDAGLSHFARFGLPPTCDLSHDLVDDAYLELSRRFHPDRFVGRDARSQRLALQHSSAINEGYNVLRDRVRRAEYLVKLAGIDLDSNDRSRGAPVPDQRLLVEMIGRREELEECASRGMKALAEMQRTVEARADALLDEACAEFERDEVKNAARALVEHRYLRRLLDEIEAACT
ncbi:MAG: Fe-S protein assembly co-chaperone HscB [Nannocystaceae bacterium]